MSRTCQPAARGGGGIAPGVALRAGCSIQVLVCGLCVQQSFPVCPEADARLGMIGSALRARDGGPASRARRHEPKQGNAPVGHSPTAASVAVPGHAAQPPALPPLKRAHHTQAQTAAISCRRRRSEIQKKRKKTEADTQAPKQGGACHASVSSATPTATSPLPPPPTPSPGGALLPPIWHWRCLR